MAWVVTSRAGGERLEAVRAVVRWTVGLGAHAMHRELLFGPWLACTSCVLKAPRRGRTPCADGHDMASPT